MCKAPLFLLRVLTFDQTWKQAECAHRPLGQSRSNVAKGVAFVGKRDDDDGKKTRKEVS